MASQRTDAFSYGLFTMVTDLQIVWTPCAGHAEPRRPHQTPPTHRKRNAFRPKAESAIAHITPAQTGVSGLEQRLYARDSPSSTPIFL